MLASALVALAGCTLGGASDLPDLSTHSQATAGADAAASAPSVDASAASDEAAAKKDDWRQAARRLDYHRAYELLSAVPESERQTPALRLAMGRIALGADKHGDAVKALDGLETKLPSLRAQIRDWYAKAAAVAGPHAVAAELLAASPKIERQLAAAEAWVRAGNAKKGRKLADAAVRRARRNRRRSAEVEAHVVRARIAEKAKDVNIATIDWRWLVKNHPSDPRVREAIAAIDRMKGALTVNERATGLAETATRDNVKATIDQLEELAKKHPAEAVAMALAKARALYKVRDYPAARDAYDAAAKLPSGFVAEALYYAARSTFRAGDHDGAITRYRRISTRFPKNGWAERAAFRHAELLAIVGRHADAAKAWGRYSSRFGKGKHAFDARHGRAVALLNAGEAKKARKLFAGLRKDANHWREKSSIRQLEGLAAMKAGDLKAAKTIWLEIVAERPLTWAALAAHARLAAVEHSPLPPAMPAGKATAHSPLPIELPAGPKLLASVGLDWNAEQLLAGMEQEAGERYVGRESEALCEMYGTLSGARRRYKAGARGVSLEQLMRPPTTRERWAWNCLYPQPYEGVVAAAEKRFEVPAGLVHAVMRQESAFRTMARSPVGAQGLMQLMPNTARRAAEESGRPFEADEVWQPAVNIELGAFYLGKLLRNFGGSLPLAAAGYNAGPHAVQSWLAHGTEEGEMDLWVARIPYRETRNYVRRVMANHRRYQWLAGGPDGVTPLSLAVPTGTSIGDDAY